MLTLILVIIGLSVLILAHEAGHLWAAKKFGMKVEEFGIGFPPRMFAKRKGGTEYSVNWLPFGGFVKIAGETDRLEGNYGKLEQLPAEEKKHLFLFQPAWRRAVVLLAGVAVNFILGWLLLSLVFMVGAPSVLLVGGVEPGSPADKAGVQAGDVIQNYRAAQPFIDFINASRGKETSFDLNRNGRTVHIVLTPRAATAENQGAIGVLLTEGGIAKESFFRALWDGLVQSWDIARLTVLGFLDLARNLIEHGTLLAGVVGPLGIVGIAEQTSKVGFIYLLQLLSLISINLAILNLVPFPALDGGRFAMIIFEKIKGSPISPKLEGIVNGIGFLILLLLMALITIRDIGHIF